MPEGRLCACRRLCLLAAALFAGISLLAPWFPGLNGTARPLLQQGLDTGSTAYKAAAEQVAGLVDGLGIFAAGSSPQGFPGPNGTAQPLLQQELNSGSTANKTAAGQVAGLADGLGVVTANGSRQGRTRPPPGDASLLRADWLAKYGRDYRVADPKPEVWVLCTGSFSQSQVDAFKRRRGNSSAVSLNTFLTRSEFLDHLGIVPTHHWMVEVEAFNSGSCLKKQKVANITQTSECFLGVQVGMAAIKHRVRLIAKKPMISFWLARFGKEIKPLLHDVKDWLLEWPAPVTVNALTLGHGIQIAVALTPGGAVVKLFGCDGTRTKSTAGEHHKDLDYVASKLKPQVKALRHAGPGWDVVNCNPQSLYVKRGAMRGGSCFD